MNPGLPKPIPQSFCLSGLKYDDPGLLILQRVGSKPPVLYKPSIVIIWLFSYSRASSFEWSKLNPLSSHSLRTPNKDDSRGPKSRAKISLSSWLPATIRFPGNPAFRTPVLSLRFQKLVLRTSLSCSPGVLADRVGAWSLEPG